MDNHLEELLNDQIEQAIQNLNGLEAGTEAQTAAVNNLAKLYQLKNDESKLKANAEDNELKAAQFKEQIKNRKVDIGIAAAELMIPLIFYGYWMRQGFKFEQTGAVTSSFFRQLINRIKPAQK